MKNCWACNSSDIEVLYEIIPNTYLSRGVNGNVMVTCRKCKKDLTSWSNTNSPGWYDTLSEEEILQLGTTYGKQPTISQ